MEDYSLETLRRIEKNDDTLIELGICNDHVVISKDNGRFFTSADGGDYSQLGTSIGRNTHLKTLYVKLDSIGLSITDSGFFEGIKKTSSIDTFKLSGYSIRSDIYNPIGEVGCELLKAFQENSSNLTELRIWCCDISSIDERVINKTLSTSTNLKTLHFNYNNMTGEQILPMVEAIRGHGSLEILSLDHNRISNVGCQALATLLEDPNCQIHTLRLNYNIIDNEGANTLAKSLVNNTKLKKLELGLSEFEQSQVENAFSRVLCDTTSINATYSSNHTLTKLSVGVGYEDPRMGIELASLLKMNKGINKKYIAIEKILQHHPNIGMEPLFEWGSGNERNLMALPYVIDWFDRAEEAVEYDDESVVSSDDSSDYSDSDDSSSHSVEEDDYDYQVEERKLTAIYEFALAMPVLFVPLSNTKSNNKKRKAPYSR